MVKSSLSKNLRELRHNRALVQAFAESQNEKVIKQVRNEQMIDSEISKCLSSCHSDSIRNKRIAALNELKTRCGDFDEEQLEDKINQIYNKYCEIQTLVGGKEHTIAADWEENDPNDFYYIVKMTEVRVDGVPGSSLGIIERGTGNLVGKIEHGIFKNYGIPGATWDGCVLKIGGIVFPKRKRVIEDIYVR